jgi:ribosome-associated protein
MGTGGQPPRVAEDEVEFTAIRAAGPGGQNVNKVSTAVRLRFDIATSSLPDLVKQRLLALSDQRISADGVVQIKAQSTRSQEQNKAEALARLQDLVDSCAHVPKPRRPTRPSASARRQRVDSKTTRGRTKRLRGRVGGDDN